ncbi:MAG: hypothetical protein QOJ84_2449 [Bradyrhizobium sp.]|nr:hypothetical protein [Bradyrhizobium sp.]
MRRKLFGLFDNLSEALKGQLSGLDRRKRVTIRLKRGIIRNTAINYSNQFYAFWLEFDKFTLAWNLAT